MTETTAQEATEGNEVVAVAAKNPVRLTVQNPTVEEMTAILENIKVNFNFDVNVKSVDFNFKKSKDKLTGIETIRDTVQLAVPYPSVQGIIAILEAGEPGNNKGLDLLLDAMEGIVNTQAREMLYDDTSATASTLDVSKLSWEFISNIPKVQRRGGGIPKEVWEAFSTDYIEVMPEVTGRTIEATTNMTKVLVGKLSGQKTNTPVLELVVEQLAVYAANSPNFAEYVECVEFLLNKADTFLNMSEEDLLANL